MTASPNPVVRSVERGDHAAWLPLWARRREILMLSSSKHEAARRDGAILTLRRAQSEEIAEGCARRVTVTP